jgi:hypothetical protein
MTHSNNPVSQPSQASLIKPMILGTVVGLVAFFFFSRGEAKPEWGPLWKVRPLIVLLLSGAFWGVCFNYLVRQKYFPLSKIATVVLGVLGLLLGIWMGVVVGFDGTMWD